MAMGTSGAGVYPYIGHHLPYSHFSTGLTVFFIGDWARMTGKLSVQKSSRTEGATTPSVSPVKREGSKVSSNVLSFSTRLLEEHPSRDCHDGRKGLQNAALLGAVTVSTPPLA